MPDLLSTLILAATLGCALVAGIFFAFSTFVMRALGLRPAGEGIAAMQAINVTVLNPWFLGAFFGTAGVCVFVALLSFSHGIDTRGMTLLSGVALYLLGCILVTMVGNVPLNNRLASVDPASADAATVWQDYLRRWTFWNHVRTAASLAAAGCFGLAI